MPRGPQTEDITIDTQLYRINKFTPDKACKWAFRLFGSMANMSTEDDFIKKVEEFTAMPEKDFKEFQKDCLQFVVAVYPAQNAPVINNDGTIALADIAATTIFQLTLHSFMFSISDFFDPALLESLMGMRQGASKASNPAPVSPEAPASTTTPEPSSSTNP